MATQKNDTEKTARGNLLGVRSDLMHNLPFFGTLSLSLKTAVDYHVRSIATDGISLKYNPQWVANATHQQIKSALAACVVSCAFHQHLRRNRRSYGRWQKACNLVITPILIQQGMLASGEGRRMSAERAYDKLEEEAQEEQQARRIVVIISESQDTETQCDSHTTVGSSNQAASASKNGKQPPDGGPEQQQDDENGAGSDQPKPDQTQQEWDENDPTGHLGEVQDFPGESEEDFEESANRWTEITMKSILLAKQQGLNPGDLAEHIAAMLQPTIDWRTALRNLLTEYVSTRDTWSRPDRRTAANGPYLAGKEPHGAPPIAFAVDTSGSMSNKELAEVWAEVRECADAMLPETIRIIQCDAAIADDQTFEPEDLPQELDARGRGGTLFQPVFDLLEAEWGENEIGCLIYLSDLYCSDYPSIPPEYPVIWVGSSNANQTDPPFGIRLDIDQ